MATPPLVATQQKWRQRAAMAQQIGVPSSSVDALANYDIQRVKAGSQPLSNQEVEDALNAQLYKGPVVQPSQPHGILNILGNVPSDVGGIIRGFIPGLAHFATHLPSEIGQLGSDLAHPSLHSLTHDPILSLIPGVYDVGQLATPEGRQWMEEHPVSSLLDVLPLASSAGKAAMAGREVEAGTASEALARGNVVRAGIRYAGDRPLPLVGRVRPRVSKWWSDLGLGPESRDLNRFVTQLTREGRTKMRDKMAQIDEVVAGMSLEERKVLHDEATIGGGKSDNPVHQSILNTIRELNQGMFVHGAERKKLYGIVVPGGHEAIYDYGSRVAKLHRKVERVKQQVEANERRVYAAGKRLDDQVRVAEGLSGKIRKFGESDEEFARRTPHDFIGAPQILEALQPLSQAFMHLNPMEVFGEYLSTILSDESRAAAGRQIIKDFKELEGEFPTARLPDQPQTGLFANLEEAIKNGDYREARAIVKRIRQVVGKKSWDGFNSSTRIRSFLTELQDALTGLKAKEARGKGAVGSLQKAQDRYKRATDRLGTRRRELDTTQAEFTDRLSYSPDASFHPAIIQNIRSTVADRVRTGNIQASAHVTADVYDRIQDTPNEKFLKSLVGDEEYRAIRESAMKMWLDMAKAGFDPIWIKKADSATMERAMFPKPLLDRKLEPSQFKPRVLNFGPGIEDIAAGVTAAESELIAEEVTSAVLDHVAATYGKSQSAVQPEYERFARDAPGRLATHTAPGYAADLMMKEWVRFDPEAFGLSRSIFAHHPDDLLIPKGIARSMEIMRGGYRLWGKEYEGGFFGVHGAYDKALHIFRLSVLTGPRHFIHVAGGGMAFLALRQPLALRQLGRAWALFNEGKVPNELMGAVTDYKADQVWNYKVGQKIGGLWRDFAGKAGDLHDKYVAFEQKVATVQRAASYLESAPKIGHDAALHEAYKTFVELDGMAPLERAVMKQMIPFYPFMRHLFRYLFALPVDHPYRVAILARFAQQEQEDWTTGLPEMYQSYLFLGEPDQNGNVVGIDTKNINPFRSFYNDFTLAGFVSAANPLFTSFGTAMGLNVLSASPNLYSDWSYNPVTGGKTTNRPMNFGAALLESFIPETQAIDATVGLSNRYRALRQSNPAAFQRELFNYLNIPFATSKVNIPLVEERAELTRFQAAQNAVSQAMKSGDWSEVLNYNEVPYNGQLVSSDLLAAQMTALQQLLAQYGIADPNAIIRKPATTVPFHLG